MQKLSRPMTFLLLGPEVGNPERYNSRSGGVGVLQVAIVTTSRPKFKWIRNLNEAEEAGRRRVERYNARKQARGHSPVSGSGDGQAP